MIILNLFIRSKDEMFLEEGDTLMTPSRFGNIHDNISNKICRLVRNDFFKTVVEIDGKEHSIYQLTQLSLTKETKIKTLSKQITLMEYKLKEKKDEMEEILNEEECIEGSNRGTECKILSR